MTRTLGFDAYGTLYDVQSVLAKAEAMCPGKPRALGLAGREQNWAYAAYELGSAARAEILPKYRDLSIPEMIRSTVTVPLAALDRAIQAKDISQFTVAYGQLTVSCNSCHQSYDRAVIVIQPPTVSSFPDQGFPPARPMSHDRVEKRDMALVLR